MADPRTLKELCEIRDAVKLLLQHGAWFGNTEVLFKALERVENLIAKY